MKYYMQATTGKHSAAKRYASWRGNMRHKVNMPQSEMHTGMSSGHGCGRECTVCNVRIIVCAILFRQTHGSVRGSVKSIKHTGQVSSSSKSSASIFADATSTPPSSANSGTRGKCPSATCVGNALRNTLEKQVAAHCAQPAP